MTFQKDLANSTISFSSKYSFVLLWAPCISALLYLSGSLLLFKFGPIDWPVQNEGQFWTFNALYLSMFLIGYAAALGLRRRWIADKYAPSIHDFTVRFFWPIWICAFLVILIGHRNITMTPSYIPTTIFSDFITGLITPEKGYVYKLSDEAKSNFSGNPPITLMFGVLSFSKLVLVSMLVSAWPRLTRLKKIMGIAVAIFPIISGVNVGTNKPIFDVAFVFSCFILIYILITPKNYRLKFLKARVTLISLTLFIILFAGAYFQHTMSVRAGGLEYAESLSSKAGQISVKPGFRRYCESSSEWILKGCRFFSTGTIYLTQGYYGMSLSINLPFETTYGLGHSGFMIETLRKYLDIDLKPRTFQQKIDNQWSAAAQWHSAYSQWANDVGFPGVALVMLALGFYVCTIWISALQMQNVAAVCSLPLLATLIFFIPANNQIFNIFESLMAFLILLIGYLGSLVLGTLVRTSSR